MKHTGFGCYTNSLLMRCIHPNKQLYLGLFSWSSSYTVNVNSRFDIINFLMYTSQLWTNAHRLFMKRLLGS